MVQAITNSAVTFSAYPKSVRPGFKTTTFSGSEYNYHKSQAKSHRFSSILWAALAALMTVIGFQSANIIPNKENTPVPVKAAADFGLGGMDTALAVSYALKARKESQLAKKDAEAKKG